MTAHGNKHSGMKPKPRNYSFFCQQWKRWMKWSGLGCLVPAKGNCKVTAYKASHTIMHLLLCGKCLGKTFRCHGWASTNFWLYCTVVANSIPGDLPFSRLWMELKSSWRKISGNWVGDPDIHSNFKSTVFVHFTYCKLPTRLNIHLNFFVHCQVIFCLYSWPKGLNQGWRTYVCIGYQMN